MLVLTRKTQQQIQIGPHITITILKVKGQSIRVGIDAPRDVAVLRAELADKLAVDADRSVAKIKTLEVDVATLAAAVAANQREGQRAAVELEVAQADAEVDLGSSSNVAVCGRSSGTAQASDIVRPLTAVICRKSRSTGAPRLGTRNRRRLMALAATAQS